MKRNTRMIAVGIVTLSALIHSCAGRPEPIKAEQTGDDAAMWARVLDDCAEAMGGTDVIANLTTLRMAHDWPDHGTLRTEIERPNKERLGDGLVWDGNRCSLINPTGSVPEEEWLDNEIDIAWFVPAFFDYPVDSIEKRTVDGVDSLMIQVTLPLGAVMSYYVDAETYLTCKVAADFTLHGGAHHVERDYRDYREVDGLVYPHAFTYQGRDGVTRLTATLEKLEINLPLDGRFDIPE
jgi:hypothetical protein